MVRVLPHRKQTIILQTILYSPKCFTITAYSQVNNDNSEIFSVIKNAIVIESSGIIFTVSPNPASGYINVFIAGTANAATIEIFNMAGQKVLQKENINTLTGRIN